MQVHSSVAMDANKKEIKPWECQNQVKTHMHYQYVSREHCHMVYQVLRVVWLRIKKHQNTIINRVSPDKCRNCGRPFNSIMSMRKSSYFLQGDQNHRRN